MTLERAMTRRVRHWLGAALLALATAACGSSEEPEPALLTTDGQTLNQAIAGQRELRTTAEALKVAQLNEVFDGAGSYTVLAPTDAAFEALGAKGEQLLSIEERPLLVGLLREHVLPGHVTPAAIAAAIRAGDGSAVMTTLGGGAITFKLDGETIVATHNNGAVARFAGAAIESGNGVAVPIDAVLLATDAGGGSAAQ